MGLIHSNYIIAKKKKSYISLQKPIRVTQQFLLKCRTDKKKKLRKINNILL